MSLQTQLATYNRFRLFIIGFIASFALTLIIIVDIRRAFLGLNYIFKSSWINISPIHAFILALSLAGMFLFYQKLCLEERFIENKEFLAKVTKLLALSILIFLIVDLIFLYRGVAASRIALAGSISIKGEGIPATTTVGLIPIQSVSPILRPFASAINYLAAVWHAIAIGLLLAGVFITALAEYVKSFWSNVGKFRTTLLGTMLALPQPFCSCCASPIAASLYRKGAPLHLALSFLIASPMLNITTLILAFLLLPPDFALLRIGAGILLVIPVSYLLSLLVEKSVKKEPSEGRFHLLTLLLNRYCNLFHFEQLALKRAIQTPSGFIRAWFKTVWGISRVFLPISVMGAIVTAVIVEALRPGIGNTLIGVLVAAVAGTLLMVSTWTELPVAGILIEAGLRGPAATLLITLPAVSVPCLVVFGGALGSLRTAMLLGLTVFVIGLLFGIIYL
jgi:hypothetical protein